MPKGKKLEPWHKQPGEGFKAFELFMTYISLGSERTVAKVAEMSGRGLPLCQQICTKFKWIPRAHAYENWMVSVQEKAIENTLAKDAIKYAQRRSIYRDLEYTLGNELLQQALQMAKAPLYETVVTKLENIKTVAHPEGEEIAVAVTVVPTKWTKRDATAYAKVASEIMRLSLEMETSRPSITVNLQDPQVRLQMARASYEQWKKDIDQLVDEQMAATPDADRAMVTAAILAKLPDWAAADWKLAPEQIPLLLQGLDDDVLPLNDMAN